MQIKNFKAVFPFEVKAIVPLLLNSLDASFCFFGEHFSLLHELSELLEDVDVILKRLIRCLGLPNTVDFSFFIDSTLWSTSAFSTASSLAAST